MSESWERLAGAGARLRKAGLRRLFAADAERFRGLSFALDDLLVDLSRELVDRAALDALLGLARAAGVESRRDAMFAGGIVNPSEGRAALHAALRGGTDPDVAVSGRGVAADVAESLARFLAFAEDVRTGRHANAAGAPFTDVVNIGIGGSDLGPAMAARALAPDADGPRLHFVSNVDGAHLADTLRPLDARRTLLIVASKTFTTMETMANARSARAWLEAAVGAAAGRHMAAVSTATEATAAFGIEAGRVFGFADWVGGRYSVWSPVGLPLAIAIGAARFREFLDGAAAMDRHFRSAPLAENLPVLLGLTGVWRRNVMGWPTVAVIPYDQRLDRFPAYIQQLAMESNGKRVAADGAPVPRPTAPVVWGEPGTNAQHSFFQLLHQGSDVVPVDFILAARPRDGAAGHHALLLANGLAQGQALAFGRTADEARAAMAAEGLPPDRIVALLPHRTFPGDRPSTTILHGTLDARSLGRLIALYEHKVFTEAAIWGVNAFDQWGVELGKQLALPLVGALTGDGAVPPGLDSSTAGLLAALRDRGFTEEE